MKDRLLTYYCTYFDNDQYIRSLLLLLGFGVVWLSQSVGEKVAFLQIFKDALIFAFMAL